MLLPPDIHIKVDGEEVRFVNVSKPRIIEGRVYARVCTVSKPLGVKMTTYDVREGQWVQIEREGLLIKMPMNSKLVTVRGREAEVDSPAMFIKGEGFFPLREVAELLGKSVYWDADTLTVIIRSKPGIPLTSLATMDGQLAKLRQ